MLSMLLPGWIAITYGEDKDMVPHDHVSLLSSISAFLVEHDRHSRRLPNLAVAELYMRAGSEPVACYWVQG